MKGKYFWLMVALCGMAGATTGICMNAAGLFYTAIAEELGIGRAAVAMTSTIMMLVSSVAGLLVAKVIKEENLKKIIFFSACCVVGGTFLMGFAHSLTVLYLLNAVRGFGFGFTSFVLATYIINHWFVEKVGLMTSIVMAFSGVPGMVLSPVINAAINALGWHLAYMVVAGILLVFYLPSFLVKFSLDPAYIGMKPYGWKEDRKEETVSTAGEAPKFNWADPAFWLIIVFSVFVCLLVSIPNHFPSFAETVGQTAALGSVMLSLSMGGNICSKILFGSIVDKAGSRNSILLIASINLIADVILLVFRSRTMLLVGSFMYTFTYCNSAVGIAVMVRDMFGLEGYNKVYPVVQLCTNVVTAFAGTLAGFAYDLTGGYTLALYVALGLQIGAMALTTCLYAMKKKRSA